MTGSETPAEFRLGYVPGVTPAKWVRMWQERVPEVPLTLVAASATEAARLVRERAVDVVLLRLPIDRTGLHAIPLYTESTVVVMPKDHPLAEAEELTAADLAESIVLHPLDDALDWTAPPGRPAIARPATTKDAVELAAAGVGLVVVPQSLARLHHRRDVTYRPLPEAPASQVALSWLEDEDTELIEQFIGIVRGRTVNSTRGRTPTPPAPPAPAKPKKPTAQKKPAATGRKPARGAAGRNRKPRRAS